MTQSIQILIEKLSELKARTKETNEELKLALEDTDVYRDILQASMEDKRYNVTEKIARVHAHKVALKHFTPPKEDA
jgi:molecular chaperone GrpE (heat shock protein)